MTQPTNSIELPKPPYCAVCGMKTNSRLNISWGRSIVVLCGGHDMNDLRAVARGADTSAKDNSIDSELEEVISNTIKRAMNFYQDASSILYDIENLKSEALQAIKAKYVSRKEIEEALKDDELLPSNMTGFVDEVGYNEDIRKRNRLKAELRAKLLPPTKGGNDE